MTRRSDDPAGEGAPDAHRAVDGRVDPRFDPAFQRGGPPVDARAAAHPGRPPAVSEPRDLAHPGAGEPDPGEPVPPREGGAGDAGRPVVARWLAPVLWILAVAFPAAGLALRAAAIAITSSMPYSSFGDPVGARWLLDLAPLLTVLAPGIVAGGPVAAIAALAAHAVRRPPRRPSA